MNLIVKLLVIIAVVIAPVSFAQNAAPAANYEAKSQKLNRAQIDKL